MPAVNAWGIVNGVASYNVSMGLMTWHPVPNQTTAAITMGNSFFMITPWVIPPPTSARHFR